MKKNFKRTSKAFRLILILCLFILFSGRQSTAGDASDKEMQAFLSELEARCDSYGWNDIHPRDLPWQYYRTTQQKRPLIFLNFGSGSNCTVFLGGVHGDELPSAYLLLKLAETIKENPDLFENECIVIAPLINPDGFFAKTPQRTNGNGIDINRNFPTKDWQAKAFASWVKNTKKNKRYYPGRRSNSEQETQFQIALIKRFKPQKILTIHSPLGFYDYDGPSSELNSFEQWIDEISKETNHPFKKFGVFPGSLGNYAGVERNILTLTLELPSSEAAKGHEFFDKFYSAFMKFMNLSLDLK